MQTTEERHGSVVVLAPSGDMDITMLPDFEGRLNTLIDEGVRAVLWDLGEVGILPSTALGFLLQSLRRLGEVGGHMALARANPFVRSTLSTMGVLDVFTVFETTEDGVRDLQARLSPPDQRTIGTT